MTSAGTSVPGYEGACVTEKHLFTPHCLGIKFKGFCLEFKTTIWSQAAARSLSLGIPDADPAPEAWLCGPDGRLCTLTEPRIPPRPPSLSL